MKLIHKTRDDLFVESDPTKRQNMVCCRKSNIYVYVKHQSASSDFLHLQKSVHKDFVLRSENETGKPTDEGEKHLHSSNVRVSSIASRSGSKVLVDQDSQIICQNANSSVGLEARDLCLNSGQADLGNPRQTMSSQSKQG